MPKQPTQSAVGDRDPVSTSNHALTEKHTPIGASAQREHELLQCEATIRQVLVEGLFQAGAVLRKIRDEKLYEDFHDSFDGYVALRWGWSSNYAHRLIVGAKMYEVLADLPIGKIVLPTAESQVRPLAQLKDADKQRAAWKLAVETSGGRVPTAEQVKAAILEIGPPPPEDRRAKSNTPSPILDQTTPDEPVGGNDNPSSASNNEDSGDRTDGKAENAVEVTALPIRSIVPDEDESSRDSDGVLPTAQLAPADIPDRHLPLHTDEESSNYHDDGDIGRESISAISGTESNAPKDITNEEQAPCDMGNQQGQEAIDESDTNETARGVLALDITERSTGQLIITVPARPAALLGDAEEDSTHAEGVALQPLLTGSERLCNEGDKPAASGATRFVLADGSEVFSTIIVDGEHIAPELVQQALDAAKRKSTSGSPTGVAGQQHAVVFLAEFANLAIRAKKCSSAVQVLSSVGSALILWQGLLTKKGVRK